MGRVQNLSLKFRIMYQNNSVLNLIGSEKNTLQTFVETTSLLNSGNRGRRTSPWGVSLQIPIIFLFVYLFIYFIQMFRKKKSRPLLLFIRCVSLSINDKSCNHGNSGNSLKAKKFVTSNED